MKKTLLLLSTLLFLGCGPEPTKQLNTISYGNYVESSYEKIPSWEDENFAEAFKIFQRSCQHISSNELFKVACANTKTSTSPREFFEKNFTPFISLSKESLVTGYYEPVLYGSLKKSKTFAYPVYGVPNDMFSIDLLASYQKEFSKPLRGHVVNKKIKPYFSRAQIDKGAIKTKPICYVDDKIDLYFLQEYGSGKIILPNKKSIYLGYADHNGHPYHSIKDEMIQKNLIKEKELTPKKMRDYLRKNSSKQDEIFQSNNNYKFFQQYKEKEMGTLGMPLEVKRSVAVDKRSIPLGMPIFVDMKEALNDKNIKKIMFAHDTQEGLQGDAHLSIFYGSGKSARNEAEATHEKLRFWILVPNDYLHHDYMLKSKYL